MLGVDMTPQRATFEHSWEAYTLLAPSDSLFLPRANSPILTRPRGLSLQRGGEDVFRP